MRDRADSRGRGITLQNRYVGDVGDFGKYGLLRALCRPESAEGPALKLGVVWYLTPDETHNNDGGHIGYLNPTPKNIKAFRRCDPELYDMLGAIVRSGDRQVSAISDRRVLPEETVYFDRVLDISAERFYRNPAARILAREQWCQDAVQATKDCDVLFVDPDNGIGSSSQAHSRRGAKHVLLRELGQYFGQGKTLVIYHHLNRLTSAEAQVTHRLEELQKKMSPTATAMAIRYRRGSSRVFFLCLNPAHRRIFARKVRQMMNSPWQSHFAWYIPPGQ